ncbi:MAG: type II toxin-antitoxin system VapC family toxin [Deltaproteobacteria bacterium]|nr:type II toxin-antitoxin system VapC family toxin [Deltaproteobacteria bacterium]
MVIYLDTSSLVKLYVEEESSGEVEGMVQSSKVTATSLIAYAEARVAFARRFREKSFSSRQYRELVSSFDEDWDNYLIVRVTKELVQLAGNLAEKHGLRGFDAIHLSSALILRQELSTPVGFLCYDISLFNASQLEGFSGLQ